MKKLMIYLAADWLQLIGGIIIGASLPIGKNIFPFWLMFVGIICMGISCYYKFYYREQAD